MPKGTSTSGFIRFKQLIERVLGREIRWAERREGAPRWSTLAARRACPDVRLHVVPHLGDVKLAQLTGPMLSKLYRTLETEGRADGTGGLSARTVRYVHTIVHRALGDAVRNGHLPTNPADRAVPPSAKDARPPEMRTWTAAQLSMFLTYVPEHHSDLSGAWVFMAATGVRRGECLALRWGDIDLEAARVSIRRSATLVKHKGSGESVMEGGTKGGTSRVIDLDPGTITLLRKHRAGLARIGLGLARNDALVFGRPTGEHLHPERFSRRFTNAVAAARRVLGADVLACNPAA